MRIICQHCGQNYEVKDSREGEIVNCQKCNNPIMLPEIQRGYKVIVRQEEQKTKVIKKPIQIKSGTVANSQAPSSLTRCPACGREVSIMAVSCPGCGHPIKRDNVVRVKFRHGSILAAHVCDAAGNTLASGYNGEVKTFSVDKPTQIFATGGGYFEGPPCIVEGGDKYEVTRNGFWQATLRLNKVDVIDSE